MGEMIENGRKKNGQEKLKAIMEKKEKKERKKYKNKEIKKKI